MDRLLRDHGFRISKRKGNEEPIWDKWGFTFGQSEALSILPEDELKEAERLQKTYCDGYR